MARWTSIGKWEKTFSFLRKNQRVGDKIDAVLTNAAERGVQALAANTPINTGLASDSWSYEITRDNRNITITWVNNDIEGGYNVALLIQYGHGTGTGGYVAGRDFINPAIQPVFDAILDDIWKEVTA